MMPINPKKIASAMMKYDSIFVNIGLVSAFVRIILEVYVAPGIDEFVVPAL